MINVMKKINCCGCTSCANVCPCKAITMMADEEGFLYPNVDSDKCIECGLCEKSCPVTQLPKADQFEPITYAMRVKNESVLKHSTSGGFVTPLMDYILAEGGAVCAVGFDSGFVVKHLIIESAEDVENINSIKGSKYVQSDLGDCFGRMKKLLDEKRQVCFVGTPCQVFGFKSFLKRDYENLICVDLVCHGVPSPKLWSKYLEYQKNRYHSEISSVSFRNKTYGYHSGTMKIEFKNDKVYFGSARIDYMLKSFYSDIASRPICYECPFKTLNRCSDFTIYECWHFSELVDDVKDDDKGYTNVIVQSSKGMKCIDAIKNSYELYKVDTEMAIKLDGVMVLNSATPHPKREEFYKGIDCDTLPNHVKQFISFSLMDRLIESAKKYVFRTGLYWKIKRMTR